MPGQDKQYVQHLMLKDADRLRRLIVQLGAYVYVCGDARRMARDVFDAIVRLLQEDSTLSQQGVTGEDYIKGMKKARRWQEDVW